MSLPKIVVRIQRSSDSAYDRHRQSCVSHPDTRRVVDMMEDFDACYTSDYPCEHLAYSENNKKVLGKMKDECNSCIVAKLISLRPKMYFVLEADGHEKRKAKCVTECLRDKALMHKSYFRALFDERKEHVIIHEICSRYHEVFTSKIKKIDLLPNENARYVLDDRVTTLAFGYHRTWQR